MMANCHEQMSKGWIKIATECGIGSGTVQRIRREMAGAARPFDSASEAALATIRRAKTGVMNSIRPCCERRCALLLGRQPSLHRNKSSYALVNKKLIGSLVL
jgi:hypothetical protein